MFNKLSVLVALLPLVSALQFQTPQNVTSAATATFTWTQEANDPAVFSLQLVNTIFHDTFAIANNVQPTAGTITLTLPAIPTRDGYTLQAINIGNAGQVFATSGDFPALANPADNTSTISSSSSGTPVSSGGSSGRTTLSTPASVSTPPPASSSAFGRTVAASSTPTSSTPSSSESGAAQPSSSVTGFNAAQGLGPNLVSVSSVAVMVLGAVAGAAVFAL